MPRLFTCVVTALLLSAAATNGNAEPAIKLDGMAVETPKHLFVIAPTGLPQQITIKADATELPLELRHKDAEISQTDLRGIGRGEQLREPMRIVARVAGQEAVAEPVKPCEPGLRDGRVIAKTELRAGKAALSLEATYLSSGRMDVVVSYGGGKVDALAVVVDLAGTVDTVIPGVPVSDKVQAYNPAEFAVGTDEGLVWANTHESPPEGVRNLPGVLSRAYVGNGDRGFTWLAADPEQGFEINEKIPFMALERNKAGQVRWSIYLANRETKLRKQQTASFSILTHPARTKPRGVRHKVWTAPLDNLPRADKVLDRVADKDTGETAALQSSVVSLEGPACGDALSAEQHLAATYPISLFRYLAGTHTGLSARLRTNAHHLVKPGQSPATDRMALGRALLHDIGVDATSLAHLTEAAVVVKALEEFGCFKDDAMTEFIPYWRTADIVRCGEQFGAEDAFALATEDPLARVHLSLWRRPHGGSTKALIVVVNESAKPVREQLYILRRDRLLGGANTVRARGIVASWDMSAIPEDSDWSKRRLQGQVLSHGGDHGSDVSLLDMRDKGFVRQAKDEKGLEIYGPLYVPAYGFRIVYGAGK